MLTLTSGYGPRRIVVAGKARNWPHRGVDVRSPLGAPVVPLFDGVVIATASGRRPGAGIGAWDNGQPPLASTVSGNGVIVKRDTGGYYVEVHMDPDVEIGDRVRAGVGSLGRTDLSGQVTGAHRHIELWTALDPDTHYDPTAAVLAAAAGPKGTDTAPPPEEDDDEMAMTRDEIAEGVLQALNGPACRKIIRELIREQTDALPAATANRTLTSTVGKGERKRTIAQAIAGTENDAETALTILTNMEDR